MMIIRVKLLLEKEEIQNEISLLLEQVCPSNRVVMDILDKK